MSSSKSKSKNTNANPDDDQASIRDLLERLDLTMNDKFSTVGERFVMFDKRFTSLEEDFAKMRTPSTDKQVFVIDEKAEGPTRVANGLD